MHNCAFAVFVCPLYGQRIQVSAHVVRASILIFKMSPVVLLNIRRITLVNWIRTLQYFFKG